MTGKFFAQNKKIVFYGNKKVPLEITPDANIFILVFINRYSTVLTFTFGNSSPGNGYQSMLVGFP